MEIQKTYTLFLESQGVNTDSRSIKKGEIFIALKGDNFNGNIFADKAIGMGAVLAVIDDEKYKKDERYLLVPDTLLFLQELANYHRKQLKIPFIAITGSNGKTTTKELIAKVLSEKFKVQYTKGNYNNHIGVPLTLLQIRDAEIAIIEMGANHLKEIYNLCKIAEPDYGLITNIGKAHLEGFGSIEGVIKAKSELYDYLETKNGLVFLNGNNEILRNSASRRKLKIISYYEGESLVCDGFVVSDSYYLTAAISFINGGKWNASSNLSGNYNLENILAAACIGKYFGVDEEKIIKAIESYQPDNNRSQFIESGKNRIILDAYNANPTSMSEALKNFASVKSVNKMVILGEMKELGSYSESEHKNILDQLAEYNFSCTFLSGQEFYNFRNDYDFSFFKNTETLHEHLKINPVKDHFILIKSSRAGKFEKLRELL